MIHEGLGEAKAWDLARQVVEDVRLPDPERILAYPTSFLVVSNNEL